MSLSVIIPVHNESKNIKKTINNLKKLKKYIKKKREKKKRVEKSGTDTSIFIYLCLNKVSKKLA